MQNNKQWFVYKSTSLVYKLTFYQYYKNASLQHRWTVYNIIIMDKD